MKKYPDDFVDKIICFDCLKVMRHIPDKSIDMILCDLPYGVTARNKWDVIIPFDEMWKQYTRIIKDDGAIVLTATQPFSSLLVCSNLEMFKYEWIWEKSRPVNFLNAKKQPLRKHESILVFSKSKSVYNPQELVYKPRTNKRSTTGTNCNESGKENYSEYTNYPVDVLSIPSESKTVHPTQKPVELFEYLIKTYTNEGELILDNCIGSGTTALACINTNRHFIGIDNDLKYANIARQRIAECQS